MAISSQQTVLTVQGATLKKAGELLVEALQPYPNARIVSVVQSTSYVFSFRGDVSLLAVVNHE